MDTLTLALLRTIHPGLLVALLLVAATGLALLTIWVLAPYRDDDVWAGEHTVYDDELPWPPPAGAIEGRALSSSHPGEQYRTYAPRHGTDRPDALRPVDPVAAWRQVTQGRSLARVRQMGGDDATEEMPLFADEPTWGTGVPALLEGAEDRYPALFGGRS